MLLDYGSKLLVGVLITPLLVSYLGRTLFGTWEILMRLVGYLSVADGRPMDALRLVVANRQGSANEAEYRRTIGMAIGVWLLCLPIVSVVGMVIVWVAPTMAGTPSELVTAVRITGALLVANFVLASIAALPEAVLFGTNQGFRRLGLVALANLFGGILTIGVVRAQLGLVGLGAVQIVMTMITATLFWRVARRYVPWFAIARPHRQEIRWFAALTGWSVAGDSIAKLLLASDVVILGVLASASVVTSYVLTGYAAQAVVSVLTLALGAVVPGLAGVIGARQYDRAAALRGEMLAIGWLVATVVGCTILLWNESFLALWVGASHYAGGLTNMLLVLIMVQTTFIRSDAYVINAMLRIRERVVASAAAAGLSCVLAFVLVPRFDVPGLCVGLIGGRLVQSIAFPILVSRNLQRSWWSGLSKTIRPGLAMLVLFAVSVFLAERELADTWSQWLVGVVVTVGLALPTAFVAGLDGQSRGLLSTRLKAMYA